MSVDHAAKELAAVDGFNVECRIYRALGGAADEQLWDLKGTIAIIDYFDRPSSIRKMAPFGTCIWG